MLELFQAIERGLRALLAGGGVFLVAGCSGLRGDPRSELAPGSSRGEWTSPVRSETGGQLPVAAGADRAMTASIPDAGKVYSLPDLVDLAQSRNAATRQAWQVARAAAAGVGMAKAEYYPMLAVAATAGGGYRNSRVRTDADLSELAARDDLLGALLSGSDGKVNLDLDSEAGYTAALASLDLKWLLFDFGGRRATLDVARSATLAANLGFNATHQALAFKVVESYVMYDAARNEVEAAQVSLESARTILKATEAKAASGLATDPELLRVKQVAAEADYALITANSKQRTAYIDLAEAAVVPAGMELRIAEPDVKRMSAGLDKPLNRYIGLALSRRPDLRAKLAVVQVREAELRKARTANLPKVSLLGTAGYTGFDNHMLGSGALREVDTGLQNYGAFLTVQWPLFTGGLAENAVRVAESKKQAAEEELTLSRDKAVAEVWRGYVRAKNAISSREVAEAMLKASKASLEAAAAGYERGVVSNQDLLLARGAYAKAVYVRSEADSIVLGSLSALALGSGDIEEELIRSFRQR